jgi:PGF-pre-PGF domain-containing protein
MNKSILLLFFISLFTLSTAVLACDFCYVKNINCPTTVSTGEEFTISFDYSGTGPDYPNEYMSLFLNGKKIDCKYSDLEACTWNSENFVVTAPTTAGTYTYTTACYASDSINEEYCGMEDDSASCSVNVVDEKISFNVMTGKQECLDMGWQWCDGTCAYSCGDSGGGSIGYCGDNNCNTASGEDCGTCSVDCGSCTSPTPPPSPTPPTTTKECTTHNDCGVGRTCNPSTYKCQDNPSCGDGTCGLFETTVNCPSDCTPPTSSCTPGWKCKDNDNRAYQSSDCSWSSTQYCGINKCSNGNCITTSSCSADTDCTGWLEGCCSDNTCAVGCCKTTCPTGYTCNKATNKCESNSANAPCSFNTCQTCTDGGCVWCNNNPTKCLSKDNTGSCTSTYYYSANCPTNTNPSNQCTQDSECAKGFAGGCCYDNICGEKHTPQLACCRSDATCLANYKCNTVTGRCESPTANGHTCTDTDTFDKYCKDEYCPYKCNDKTAVESCFVDTSSSTKQCQCTCMKSCSTYCTGTYCPYICGGSENFDSSDAKSCYINSAGSCQCTCKQDPTTLIKCGNADHNTCDTCNKDSNCVWCSSNSVGNEQCMSKNDNGGCKYLQTTCVASTYQQCTYGDCTMLPSTRACRCGTSGPDDTSTNIAVQAKYSGGTADYYCCAICNDNKGQTFYTSSACMSALTSASSTKDSCSQYLTCNACMLSESTYSCGWCTSTNKCIKGTTTGPTNGQCSIWAWSTCPTPCDAACTKTCTKLSDINELKNCKSCSIDQVNTCGKNVCSAAGMNYDSKNNNCVAKENKCKGTTCADCIKTSGCGWCNKDSKCVSEDDTSSCTIGSSGIIKTCPTEYKGFCPSSMTSCQATSDNSNFPCRCGSSATAGDKEYAGGYLNRYCCAECNNGAGFTSMYQSECQTALDQIKTDSCSSFLTCSACSIDSLRYYLNCGWCGTAGSGVCVTGNSNKPTSGTCSNWFYGKCPTKIESTVSKNFVPVSSTTPKSKIATLEKNDVDNLGVQSVTITTKTEVSNATLTITDSPDLGNCSDPSKNKIVLKTLEVSSDVPSDQVTSYKIIFEIKKSELSLFGKDASDITIQHCVKGNWIAVTLTKIACNDSNYVCFKGTTSSVSPFVITVGSKTKCPFPCCLNDANYTDKNCTSGFTCENNKCVEIVAIPSEEKCPFPCCLNDANYTDKDCETGYSCKKHNCVSNSATTNPENIKTTQSDDITFLIISIIGLAIAIILTVLYVILRNNRKKNSVSDWERLYGKYKGKRIRRRR